MAGPAEAVSKVAAAAGGLAGGAGRAAAATAARAAVRGGGAAAVAWRSAGGLPPLVALLGRAANSKRGRSSGDLALGHSLSALADCCLDLDSCKEAGELLAEEPTLTVLRRAVSKPEKMTRFDDDLAGRACRLIANLAALPENAAALHSKGAALLLMKTIEKEEMSPSTLLMALRAIRLLWTNKNLREEMLKLGAVKCVSTLFSKRCIMADIVDSKGHRRMNADKNHRKKCSDLFTGLLKCIGTFTLHPVHECASQILGDGLGYRCLIALIEDYESMVVQCIVNLCYVPIVRPALGSAGAVKCLINLIKSNSEYPLKWIIALRLLCRESVNSAKCKKYDGLTLLLSIIKSASSLKSQFYTIQTLYCFIYDEDALVILAKEGFIDVIAQLIKDHVEIMNCGHQASNIDLSKCEMNKKLSTGTNDAGTSDNESMDSCNRDIPEEKNNSCSCDETYSFLEVSPHKKSKLDWSPNETLQESKNDTWKKNQSPYISPFSDSSVANNYSPDYRESKNKKHVYSNSTVDTGNSYYYSSRSPESTSSSIDGYMSTYGNSSLWSPESPGMSYSPSSTSYCDNDSTDSELSGRYSPVCSDSDEEDYLNLKYDEETNSINDVKNENDDRLQVTPKIENDDVSSDQMELQKIKYLMIFLSQYTYLPPNNIHLFSSWDLLYILVNYIEKCKYPNNNRAAKALSRIICNAANFKHVLKKTFVLHLIIAIYKPKHLKCRQCKQVQKIYGKFITQLSTIAETEFGIGEISYHLLKEDIAIKEKTATSLPHLIKSTRALKKFFIDCNGLELFLSSFEKHPLEVCVSSLTKLAMALEIRAPKPIYPSFKDCTYPDYTPDFDKNDEVVFILDDSSTVEADQQLLCRHSDVFVAMLRGLFIEGLQKRVRLQKVTKGGLEYLLILLKSKINTKKNDTFPLPKCLNVALEALLLADRFLIENIKNCLFSAIVQFKLDYTTADQIYIWSLEEGMGTLCMESVAYTLAGQMSDEKKCRIISAIMETIYKDQWIEDVRSSLLRFL